MIPAALVLLLVASDPAAMNAETFPDGTQRWSFLVTYGDEQCPPPVGDEIVACAQLPESERYRIPPPLRERREDAVGGQSWTAHVENYQEVARLARPDSCSVIGSYGYSGCTAAALRRWFAERQLNKAKE